ncbi:LPS assembly protein LptD, partial [Glaesserella parasuis]|nr:LPS assembly protein LptD [Glaesserella parasuis]MDE4000162.1 LPS assembly protein LptD [Glaesserella parasuis]
LKKLVESQLGLNYSTCCWSANFYTSRHLISTPMGKSDTINDFYYDNRFGINFEVRFNGNYEHTVPKMLKKGILPYIEAFNIN